MKTRCHRWCRDCISAFLRILIRRYLRKSRPQVCHSERRRSCATRMIFAVEEPAFSLRAIAAGEDTAGSSALKGFGMTAGRLKAGVNDAAHRKNAKLFARMRLLLLGAGKTGSLVAEIARE